MADAYEVMKTIHMDVLSQIFMSLPQIFASCALACDNIPGMLGPMALTELCPVEVGGYAYQYYMRKNGLTGIFSDDIDIKIAIQKTAEELNTTNKLVRTIIKAFRYTVISQIKAITENIFEMVRERTGIPLRADVIVGGSYGSLEALRQSVFSDIVPLDLCHLTVTYALGDTRVHMGLIDTSFYMHSLQPHLNVIKQFFMYRDYTPHIIEQNATTIIGVDPICPDEAKCMFIANPLFMLLDTVRMLSKVEPIGIPGYQPSRGDYYKFPKYVIKLLEMLTLPEFKRVINVDLTPMDMEYVELMKNILATTPPADLGPVYKQAHRTVLENAPQSAYALAYKLLYSERLQQINQVGGTKREAEEIDILYMKQPAGIAQVIRESDKRDVFRAMQVLLEKPVKSSSRKNRSKKLKIHFPSTKKLVKQLN